MIRKCQENSVTHWLSAFFWSIKEIAFLAEFCNFAEGAFLLLSLNLFGIPLFNGLLFAQAHNQRLCGSAASLAA